jgi:TRAP-type C4-dicarboxylate transport system permease small subunit
MIIIVCATVYYRYVLNYGITWAEEVPRTLVALFAFIACAMGVRDQLHIGMGFFYTRFPEGGKARKVFDMINYTLTLFIGGIMLYYGTSLCNELGRFTMPATEWPRWVQYISMPIAGGIIMYDSILYALGVLNEDDKLYSEKEVEYHVIHKKDLEEGGAN